MKQLVKTFNGYLAENLSPEEEGELQSMGFSDKTQLNGSDAVLDALQEHLYSDGRTYILVTELESRTKALCEEFEKEYLYSDEDLSKASDQLSEWAFDGGGMRDVVIANAVYKNLS